MSKFEYWATEGIATHDYQNGDELTVEEAQVLATLKVATELQELKTIISDFTDTLLNHSTLFPDNGK